MDGPAPVLYPALSVFLQLAPLRADDEERLDRAADLVWDWIGPKLTWSWLRFAPEMEKASRRDLDFISGHALRLREAPKMGGSEEADIVYSNLWKLSRTDFYVMCTGGEKQAHASPYSMRFWSEIPEVRVGEDYEAMSFLQVTVPLSHPIADFHERATALAATLRLMWGNAGHGYATWEPVEQYAQRRKMYAHARRFLGYDTGYSIRMAPFHDRIRTVSFLTFVGDPLLEAMGGVPTAPLGAPLDVARMAGGVRVRAGNAPDAGDRNRIGYPAAYMAADKLLRNARADEAFFGWPWTEKTTQEWLSRLDRRFS